MANILLTDSIRKQLLIQHARERDGKKRDVSKALFLMIMEKRLLLLPNIY